MGPPGKLFCARCWTNSFEQGQANSFARSCLTLRLLDMSGLLNLDKALQVSITAPNISGIATLVVICFVSFIIGVKFGCWQKRETLLEKPHLYAPGWLPIPRVGAGRLSYYDGFGPPHCRLNEFWWFPNQTHFRARPGKLFCAMPDKLFLSEAGQTLSRDHM